jgi:hypothetical protein
MRAAHQLRTAAAGVPCVWPPRRRVLYFDIDGTIVKPTFGRVKHAVADGRFERAVQGARFDRIVCVSDAVLLSRVVMEGLIGRGDVAGAVFRFCRGAFRDEGWFRAHVEMVANPLRRAEAIDLEDDWYYADDNARRYLRRAGLPPGCGGLRTLQCRSDSEGHELMAWLEGLVAGRPPRPAPTRVSIRRYPLPDPDSSSYARRRE